MANPKSETTPTEEQCRDTGLCLGTTRGLGCVCGAAFAATPALKEMAAPFFAAREKAAERATWEALAALHKVPAPAWWDTFKRVLAEHGHEVRPHGR